MLQIIGGVHGNEAVTTEVTLRLMKLLLSYHELDDDISRIMKGYSIHILPALNRDGSGLNAPGQCKSRNGSLSQAGVDLFNDFHTFGAVQPETRSVMTWMKQRKFLFSINFLGTDENIVVPTINGTFGLVNKYDKLEHH